MYVLRGGRQCYVFLILDCLFRLSIQSKAGISQTLIIDYDKRSNASCAKKSVFVKNAWFGIVDGSLCESEKKSACKLDVTNNIRKYCLGKDRCEMKALKNTAALNHKMKEKIQPLEKSQMKIIYQCLKVFGCAQSGTMVDSNNINGLLDTSREAKSEHCTLFFPFAVKLNLWTTEPDCGEIRYGQSPLTKKLNDGSYELEALSPKINISSITASCASPVFRFRFEKLPGTRGTHQKQRDNPRDMFDSGPGLMVGIGVCGVVIIIGLIILAWSRQLPPPGNSNQAPYLAGEQRYPERAHMVIQHEASGNAFRPSYVSAEHANSVPKSYWWSTTVNMGSQANSGSQFYTV